jgi:hypothetical protein
MQELEDKEGALILAEQVIVTAREERDELKRLNDSYVGRIGRLEADKQVLLRDIGEREDAGVGGGPTWQMLRSQRDTLREQKAMLRTRISRMKAEQLRSPRRSETQTTMRKRGTKKLLWTIAL